MSIHDGLINTGERALGTTGFVLTDEEIEDVSADGRFYLRFEFMEDIAVVLEGAIGFRDNIGDRCIVEIEGI